ncbi:MAG: aspartyl protease family protein [Treponema sp.]|jgi:clan AA aspartic protease|nr:aspartyl protease family protein [Treponema sp.]
MGEVHTEITLVNTEDTMKARNGLIREAEIRRLTVNALVDTGAWTLVINEETREKLGLRITRTDSGTLADGTKGNYAMAGPLEITWKNRGAICEAIVLPHAEEILLGAIPLEAMDLMIHPRKEEVTGAHGDQPLHSLKGI